MVNAADLTILTLLAALVLIYVEFNRPGSILPGALGLTMLLLAVARAVPQSSALTVPSCSAGMMLLAVSARTSRGLLTSLLATAALAYGFAHIRIGASQPHAAVAYTGALAAGVGTFLLTTIALRARQNKGLDSKRKAPRAPGAPPF